MSAIKELQENINKNNALIAQLQASNVKTAAMIELIKAAKPKKETFGWVEAGGWVYEGGEEAYLLVLEKWKAEYE